MRPPLGFAFLSACLLLACGSDGPGTGPVSADDAAAGCRRDCEHRISCGSTQTLDACTASCVSDVGGGWVRADAFEALVDCTTAQACDASSDVCLAECAATSAHEAFETQCRAVLAACDVDVNAFCETTPTGTGDAGFLCLITPSIMDQLTACIPTGATCPAAQTCLQGVFTANGIDF